MNANRRIVLAKVLAHAHDRAPGSYTGHESLRPFSDGQKLRPDLRTRGFFMRFAIGGIGELAREENILARSGKFFAHANAAEEAAVPFADRHNFSAIAADQVDTLLAHPIGHKDFDRMAKHAADSGEGDAGIAAGGFG